MNTSGYSDNKRINNIQPNSWSKKPSSPTDVSPEFSLRIVICEDHEVTRAGFRDICNKLGYQVVAETASGAEAIELVDSYRPDMLILDLRLRDEMPGQIVHAEIKRRGLPTKTFVVTSYYASASFYTWVNGSNGPDGVLEKEASVYEIRNAFTQVLTTGEKYIPNRIRNHEHSSNNAINPLDKLSPNQLAILREVGQNPTLLRLTAK